MTGRIDKLAHLSEQIFAESSAKREVTMADIIEFPDARRFECDCGCPNARYHELSFGGAMAACDDLAMIDTSIGAEPVLNRIRRELQANGRSLWLESYLRELALRAAWL